MQGAAGVGARILDLSYYWTLANSGITGVLIGRPSSVVTRVLTEKRQSPDTTTSWTWGVND